jgi:TDG/mug DNA glycosylase family protein
MDADLNFDAAAPPAPTPPCLACRANGLPDALRDHLDVIFVGTAAGRRSAERGIYYAHSGSYFWPTLWEVGITPRRFTPRDFAQLCDVGIGFTDLFKTEAGTDHEIRVTSSDIAAFDRKMRQHQPRAIAFTSKRAASLWLHQRTAQIRYGRQRWRADSFCDVFVLPSPAAAARRYWKIEPWRDLADWLGATRPWRF